MNPWLQRFLVSWAAGIAASGAIVSTSKKPGKLKKKRRKKKADGTDEPVQMGAVALKDARSPEDRGLTLEEWRHNVVTTTKGMGEKVASVFKRDKAPIVDESGAREPDEVQGSDGKTVRKGPSTGAKSAKRKGSIAKGRNGRRRKRRQQATLWDSAKESLKQTVKETVKEEVKATSVGSAFEVLKGVGARVKEGATAAASAVSKAIDANNGRTPPDDGIPPQLKGEPMPPRPPPGSLVKEEAPPEAPAVNVEEKLEAVEAGLESLGRKLESTIHNLADGAKSVADSAREATRDVEAPVDVADAAKKLKGGVDVVGSWLQGPGAPGYGKRRTRVVTGEIVEAKDAGDVVEAKDAPAAPPPSSSPSSSPSSPASSSSDGSDDKPAETPDPDEGKAAE